MSIATLEQRTLLCVIKHTVYNSADSFHIILNLSKELTKSRKECYLKPIYLELVHWHLLNLNTQFGA